MLAAKNVAHTASLSTRIAATPLSRRYDATQVTTSTSVAAGMIRLARRA